jgi:hypothetical protein
LDLISTATIVSITFEFQKKEVHNDTISHQCFGDSIGNGEMCLVRAALEIFKRIYSYNIPPEKLTNAPINCREIDGKGFTIPSSLMLLKIRQGVSSLGHSVLGFSADKLGTHSNQYGGAMGTFLSGTNFCLYNYADGMVVIGCLYVLDKKQVLSLSHGIAPKMLTYEQCS